MGYKGNFFLEARIFERPEGGQAKETPNDDTGFLCPNSDHWLLSEPNRSSQADTKTQT
jgi:hypothetical protein